MSPRKTLLIIDDIPLMRTILSKYVKSIGLRLLADEVGSTTVSIIEASNGKTGLQKLKENDVDLVFLDLMMPEMDGLSFLSAKKDIPRLSAIPVIVCSALSEKEMVDRARDLGAVSYIMKPFTLKTVEEKFREALTVLEH